jgi:hypothetical protein
LSAIVTVALPGEAAWYPVPADTVAVTVFEPPATLLSIGVTVTFAVAAPAAKVTLLAIV